MQIICLEDAAFYTLIDKVVNWVKEQHNIKEDKWISGEEAMRKLRISNKTTLQKLRDEGKIRFGQPEKKLSFKIMIPVRHILVHLKIMLNQ